MSKDFKLRALKSVLVMAGDLKRAAGDLPEDKASRYRARVQVHVQLLHLAHNNWIQLASRFLFHLNSRGVVLGSTVRKNTFATPHRINQSKKIKRHCQVLMRALRDMNLGIKMEHTFEIFSKPVVAVAVLF